MDQQFGFERLATTEIVESPATVDLVNPYNEVVRRLIQGTPGLYVGRVLYGNYIVLHINEEDIETVAPTGVSSGFRLFPTVLGLLGREELTASGITQAQEDPALNLRGQGVLVGIVDTGIDYLNGAFRNPDGSTRVRYIWDQSISGNPPQPGYLLGTEYTMARINEALASPQPRDLVPHRDTAGHGTFLASLAAGGAQGPLLGAAPQSELIVVKLRRAGRYLRNRYLVPESQEHAYSASDLMLGVNYIIERATALGRPVSICIGLGTNYGGHNGFDPLEEYLSRLSTRTGVAISVAAGNEALARHHYYGHMESAGEIHQIGIRAEGTPDSFGMQIWNFGTERLSVSVTSPGGEVVGRVPARPGGNMTSQLILERSRVSIEYYFPLPGSGSQVSWIRIVDPTPGVWTVSVYGDIITEGSFDAYLPMTGFVSPGVEFLNPSPDRTITLPGSAMTVLTVGGYDSHINSLYADSSWGPTRLPLLSPDLCAPAVTVQGMYPIGSGTMTGTSVAAAIAAGASAQMLQWGVVEGNDPAVNTGLIRSYFTLGCLRDPGIQYPNNQWGYGRLNLYNVFAQMGSEDAVLLPEQTPP